jgi:mannose-6-phosphate isomerase-like protein (cupin superfamily)
MKTTLKNAAHYKWGNNCDAFVLLNDKNLSVKFEKMPAGTSGEKHFHKYSQQYFFILKGEATFDLENKNIFLKENEGIHIEQGKVHRIINNSACEIEFLVISQPSIDNDSQSISS